MTKGAFSLLVGAWLSGCVAVQDDGAPILPTKPGFDSVLVEQGYRLVRKHGCNDCHTRGYLVDGKTIPMDEWLTGDHHGWHGPWGVSYASNLRLTVTSRTRDDWIELARHLKARPLMPWAQLNALSRDELAAIYEFVAYLGPKGEPVPAAMPAR